MSRATVGAVFQIGIPGVATVAVHVQGVIMPQTRNRHMTTENSFTAAELAQFTGTACWYRHPLARSVLYTDGVKFVADRAGAYWLVDEIALSQLAEPALKMEEFQVWTLVVENTTAILRCDDGNDRVLLEKRIGYTDFPEQGIKLYFTDGVIMLPGEY
jgi:hypothetical protein